MSDHPSRPEAQVRRRDRRIVRSVHSARRAQPIRSDNGPEFVAKAAQDWIGAVGAKTGYIERGSPWENGFIESLPRPGSSSRAGGATITPRGRTDPWATSRQRLKCSSPPSRRGRLSNPPREAARASRGANHELTLPWTSLWGADHSRLGPSRFRITTELSYSGSPSRRSGVGPVRIRRQARKGKSVAEVLRHQSTHILSHEDSCVSDS